MEEYFNQFELTPLPKEKKEFFLGAALERLEEQEKKELQLHQRIMKKAFSWKMAVATILFILSICNYSAVRWEKRVIKQYSVLYISPIPNIPDIQNKETEKRTRRNVALRYRFLQQRKLEAFYKHHHFNAEQRREN